MNTFIHVYHVQSILSSRSISREPFRSVRSKTKSHIRFCIRGLQDITYVMERFLRLLINFILILALWLIYFKFRPFCPSRTYFLFSSGSDEGIDCSKVMYYKKCRINSSGFLVNFFSLARNECIGICVVLIVDVHIADGRLILFIALTASSHFIDPNGHVYCIYFKMCILFAC